MLMVPDPLRVLLVYRAPVGGLFRHVYDLARELVGRGHQIGMIADASTGGERARALLDDLAPTLALGLSRVPMSRAPGPSDVPATRHVLARIRETRPDVVHGHGAKGGAYARIGATLAGTGPLRCPVRVYTPHGGSLNYSATTPSGAFYLAAEKWLRQRTDLFLFESRFAQDVFDAKIGLAGRRARVVHNGLFSDDFAEIPADEGATDLLFIGELRPVKGIDVLFQTMAALRQNGRELSLTLVGDGPEKPNLEALARALGLDAQVTFAGAMPAAAAFRRGRIVVVPSRRESLPYVVLEALAAGKPVVATNVGGIPEIYGDDAPALVPPDDPERLAQAIVATLDAPHAGLIGRLRERLQHDFTVSAMTDNVLAAYRAARHETAPAP